VTKLKGIKIKQNGLAAKLKKQETNLKGFCSNKNGYLKIVQGISPMFTAMQDMSELSLAY